MKSNLITKSVLRSIHKEGKELHVWTVNSRSELERLQRIGVDNIITDNPAFVKEVLYDTDSDWYLTTLFKVIVEYYMIEARDFIALPCFTVVKISERNS